MKTVIELIEANGLTLHGDIEHFAELVRADEREACAKLCAGWSDYTNGIAPTLAKAIRARGSS
jgi:hypothetical protein